MSSHFSAIGFPVREMREYWALAQRASREGERLHAEAGRVLVRWAPGGGPEIWAQVSEDGDALNATPFFASGEAYRIAVTATGTSDYEGGEGWIDGWLNPTEDDEAYSGAFPLRVDLVNYLLVRPRLKPGVVLPLRLTMILHEATLYPDAQAYAAVGALEWRPPVQSFTSSVHFAVGEEEETDATALVTGHVREASELTNVATGAAFWLLRVATTDVTLSLAADRDVLPSAPRAGQVLSASGWVLGQVLPESSLAQD